MEETYTYTKLTDWHLFGSLSFVSVPENWKLGKSELTPDTGMAA